jgi:hypothetical protein
LSDIDDPQNRIPERAVLDAPIPVGSGPGARRDQLRNLVRDYWAWDNGSDEIDYESSIDVSIGEGSWSSFADDRDQINAATYLLFSLSTLLTVTAVFAAVFLLLFGVSL